MFHASHTRSLVHIDEKKIRKVTTLFSLVDYLFLWVIVFTSESNSTSKSDAIKQTTSESRIR